MNNTTYITTTLDPYYSLPVYGLNTPWFGIIHGVALASLSTSLAVSGAVLAYLLKQNPRVWKLPVGERLIVYLSICDVLYNISHITDHSWVVHVKGHPSPVSCAIMALFLHEFTFAQSLIVLFTSANAFMMVVKERKIPLGSHDWRLLVYAFVTPLVLGLIAAGTGHFGPIGAWCYIHIGKKLAPVLINTISGLFITTFVVNIACYMLVWFKIKQGAEKAGQDTKKYHKAAKVMMLFVAAYMGQWWAFTLYAVISLFTAADNVIVLLTVLFSNLGGVFNFIAYTFVRKKSSGVAASETTASS